MIIRLLIVLGWAVAIVLAPYLVGWVRLKYQLNILPGLDIGDRFIEVWLTGLSIIWVVASVIAIFIAVIVLGSEGLKWIYEYIKG